MSQPRTAAITQLLGRWRDGDADARDALFAEVYDDLRGMARLQMQGENAGHTLQATALVNEAYERLWENPVQWEDRRHFFAIVAQVMRRLLVDHARSRSAAKRGGEAVKVPLELAAEVASTDNPALLDLDEALSSLGQRDERKEQIIELHYFGGMTQPQIADTLEISVATVERDLRMAKAWLQRAMRTSGD